jgi:hypothetical protein
MKFHSRFVASLAAALAFGLFVAASPAAAECDPETALFEDEFEFMDVTWGDPNDNIYVEDGALIIKEFGGVVNFSTRNQGGNVCVDMTIVDATKLPNSPIGIVFWWKDWDNYYSMFIWADGWIEVRRVVNGKSQALFTEETLALKNGVGATNNVELELRPKDATVFINGTKVKRFKGRQPKDGGVVGFYGISDAEEPATLAFDNFVVNETDSE